MNKKIVFLILLAMVLTLPLMAHADDKACQMIKTFKDTAIKIGASIVVIGWVITGILYLTAAGAPEKTGTAKKALIACIIGTIVIILAPTAYDFVNSALNAGGAAGGGC